MKMRRYVSGLACVWLMAACGHSASSTTPEGHAGTGNGAGGNQGENGPVTLADFPHAYAIAICQSIARCYPQVLPAGDCVASLDPTLAEEAFAQVEAAVADGSTIYDSAAAPTCLLEAATASCDTIAPESCRQVFKGTRKSGEACTQDLQCVDQECTSGSTCPGTCGRRAKLGEACSAGTSCESELACREDESGSSRCIETAGSGEPCSAEVPCRGYNYCYSPPGSQATCVARSDLPRVALDEGCEPALGPQCSIGLVCTLQNENGVSLGRCKETVTAGAACVLSFPDACPEGQHCHITTALTVKPAAGQCQDNPQLGEECLYNVIHSAPCGQGQFCSEASKLCTNGRHLGETCADSSECYSRHCNAEGKCGVTLECEKGAASSM